MQWQIAKKIVRWRCPRTIGRPCHCLLLQHRALTARGGGQDQDSALHLRGPGPPEGVGGGNKQKHHQIKTQGAFSFALIPRTHAASRLVPFFLARGRPPPRRRDRADRPTTQLRRRWPRRGRPQRRATESCSKVTPLTGTALAALARSPNNDGRQPGRRAASDEAAASE